MLEISFSYRTLFTVNILHNYYSENKTSDLVLVPTARSLALAKKLGLIIKTTENGAVVLFDSDKTDSLLYELDHNPSVKFSFQAYSKNPFFLNFTNLPIEQKNSVLYFSNEQGRKEEGNEYLLHNSSYVGEEDFQTLLNGSLKVEAEGNEKEVEVYDVLGNLVYTSKISANGVGYIDSKMLPEGKLRLLENKTEKFTFVNAGDFTVNKPIGFIDLSLSGKIKKELINGAQIKNLAHYNYKVFFESRSTLWKYLIIPKYNNAVQNSVITTNNRNISFSGPETISMSNGETAFVFLADKNLPLKERSDFNFQLKAGKLIGSGKTLINRLPLPSVEVIKPESRNSNAKVFSEIIVYV
jgi:hypothetical protein